MKPKKTVFVIPGYKHTPKNKAYKALSKILKKEGYHPILITIPWRDTTISQNSEYFLKEYNKVNRKKKYILGFSFGAMIAFLASTKVSPSGLILCSLSPYFKEDVSKINDVWFSSIKKLRYQDFSKLHSATLAKKIKAKKILMLYGAQEEKSLIHRVTKTFHNISVKSKYLIPIESTKHDIGDRRYLQTIHLLTKVLQ